MNPYAVTKRSRLSDRQRLELLLANDGKCCICGLKIEGYREKWDDYDLAEIPFIDEHIEPLWRNGGNEKSNRGPAHVRCAALKTAKEATDRAKGRAMAEKHFGAHRPRSIMPGSRRSKWKRTMSGKTVPR